MNKSVLVSVACQAMFIVKMILITVFYQNNVVKATIWFIVEIQEIILVKLMDMTIQWVIANMTKKY